MNRKFSAVSFYLRTAEYGNGILVYNSLLKVARCLDDQNDRIHTVSNCILQALSYMPERPEAYFLMSQFYERQAKWQECYTWAELGLSVSKNITNHLPAFVGYYDYYVLEFEKAVSAWWIGRRDESKEILSRLQQTVMAEEYKNAVNYNVERLDLDFI